MQKGNFMNITRDITFNQLTEAPLDRAIYNIWGECVFNECEEAKKVRISFDEAQQQFAIRYKYNNEEILNEQGHYYFTEDAHVVIYLDNPKHCQKFIAFERTENYMEIAYM